MRGILLLLACALPAYAQDPVHYNVRIGGLELTEGKLPDEFKRWKRGFVMRAVLDGPGEAYVSMTGINRWQPDALRNATLAVRAPAGKEVTGLLVLPSGKVRFRIPAATEVVLEDDFLRAKRSHLTMLLNERFAGAGHWNYQFLKTTGRREIDVRRLADQRQRRTEIRDTYDLLTGGRAVAENLQFRRGMMSGARAEEKVEVATLTGITVQEFDWSSYLEGTKPETDPLAARIPADQHAVFFPSFDAMIRMLDSAEQNGTPALQVLEERAEDAGTKQKYETQLGLRTSALARLLGPKVITSVAFTGSDPFLREGTDVAVLFEAKDGDALDALIRANRIKNSAGAAPTASETTVNGVEVHALITKGRIVHSLQFRIDNVVVVSNSLAQVEKLTAVQQSIASLDEYRFFRSRYQRNGETAFVILTDAAIRRWCSPKWRIAMSRRVRAAAALAALEAEQYEAMESGKGVGANLPNEFPQIDCGKITLTERGAVSSIYGNTRFMTPIAELDMKFVTEAEAAGYKRWRENYQRNWSRYFDPIGVQLKLSDDEIFADVTVMPLIVASEYNRFVRLAGDSRITDGAGDPHPEALFQVVMAFDHDSELARQFGLAFPSWPGIQPRTNPLRWVGQTVSFSIDSDKLFEEAAKAEDGETFIEKNIGRLPVLLHVDVVEPLVAGLFMAGLRTFVENTAPGYTKWSTRKHGEIEYVRVEPGVQADADFEGFALHYATLKGSLIFGVNEEVFKRAVDRHQRRQANPDETKHKWLGEHVAGRANRKIFQAMETLSGDDGYRGELQMRAWKNIPILNEWKRLFPGRDPVELHEKLTGIRLLCPGGGKYVWNDAWKTYESSVFGHCADPKRGPEDCLPFEGWTWGNFGVTLEKEGIRARASITK